MGVERHNAAVLSATTGTHGLAEYRSSATLVNGGFSVDVFGSDRKSEGHRDNFASVTNNLGGTVQWSNDWLRVGAQSSRNMNHSGFPGGLTEAEYAQNPRLTKTPTDFGQLKSETSAAFLEALTGDWQVGLDVGQRTRKIVTSYSGFLSNSSTDTRTANARLRHSLSNARYANTLTFGLDSENWNSSDYADLKGRADSAGIYINDDVGLLATGTHLSVGLRSENIHKTRNTSATTVVSIDQAMTAWNVGATQDLGSNSSVFARVGQSFRVANVDEFNFVTPGSSLRPQLSRDTELGARWHAVDSRLELRLYQNELTDEIAYDGSAVGPFSPFSNGANVNLDPTVHRGIELEGHHKFTNMLAMRLSAATRQSRFVSGTYSGQAIALVPTRTLAVGVEIAPAEGHALDLAFAHVSSQYTDYANQCTMPEYNTVDARYAYNVKSLEIAIGISNLTDTKYYTQSFGCTAGVIQALYPEAGRAVAASVKLSF
jgi:iron complex outermembrane receptor protein